jgi:hypothetical protein
MDFTRPERCRSQRTGREDRHSKFYEVPDNLAAGRARGSRPAATRTKDSYLQAQYQRLRPRRGHRRALVAVQHSMLIAYWHMFTTGESYRDLGGDYFRKRDPERAARRLIAQLEALGHKVTLEPAAA